MAIPLPVSPTVATIDQNNFMVINWNPPVFNGGYTLYKDWNIFLGTPPSNFPGTIQLINGQKPTGLEFPGSTVDSRIFQEQLIQTDYGLNMQAEPSDAINYLNSPKFANADQLFSFPSPLLTTAVTLDNTTLELGQTVTVTLAPSYPQTSAGAQFWQVYWPDNTTTGALPLSTRSAAKSFSSPGALNIIVKTWNDFSAATPPVKLFRQVTIPIFVIDQQFNPQATTQGSLTGTLGFGGTQGFEIVDATSGLAVPQPYSVIARCLVRDSLANELKLLVLTSRFPNASSELGTMALDVFPIEGRPHAKELIVPDQILQVTAQTSSVPAKITTANLPNVIVGKAMPQFKMQAVGGTQPYGWSNDGTLPEGLMLSVDGTISGTPVQLGTFNVNFAAVDTSVPAYVAETVLPMTVQTDLSITTPTIANARVLTPYNVQLISSGGLAPYSWTIAAGALPIGIVIDPNTGLLHGVPCTYNSTSDFVPGKTFTATVQITDAIGAKATKTYTITLSAAPLQFGPVDQTRIFCVQDFKLTVPVFGGQSPYNTLTYLDDGASSPPATHVLVDGLAEIKLDIPTTSVGIHTFALGITDNVAATANQTFNFAAGQRISDVRMKDAFFNHYWNDAAIITAIAINGSNVLTVTANHVFSIGQKILLSGITTASFLNGQTITIVSRIGGGPIYTGFTAAFTHALYASTPDTGLAEDAAVAAINVLGALAGFSLSPTSFAAANGLTVAVDPSVPDATVTGPATVFRNAEVRVPLQLLQGSNPVAQISRPYSLLAHDDISSPGEIGDISTYTRPYIVGDFVGLNPRKPYWNSLDLTSFTPTISSVVLTVRVQAASSLPTGLSLDSNTGLVYGTLLAVANSISVLEYIDALGLVHGTVTLNWTTFASDFLLIDNGALDDLQTGFAYTGGSQINAFTAPTGVTLTAASIFTGALPAGLSVTTDGTNVIVSGTTSEAGYFDAWFQAQSGARTAYIHHRVSVDFIIPLVILTTSLPQISVQPYTTNLQGYGGIPPYVSWTSPQFPAGVGAGNFAGLTLVTNGDGTGTISGTLSSPPGSSPTDLGNIQLTLTDTRGPGSAVTASLDLVYNNTLRILTPLNGIPLIDASGADYSFAMQAAGGVPPYSWQIAASPTLPVAIAFDATAPAPFAAEPAGGKFSGSTTTSGYNQTITITVQDSLLATASGNFVIKSGTPQIVIDQSGIGQIPRGQSYQGRLKVVPGTGTPVAPITWQVSPTPSHPNLLPTGLSLAPDATTNGIEAVVSGTYSGIALVGYLVRVVAADSTGQTAVAFVSFTTIANSVVVTTTSLPNATIGGSYNFQLQATGGVLPYTWGASPSFPFNGISLSSGGLLTGSATSLFSQVFNFTVTDSLGNTSAATPLTLTSQAAGLAITTTQAQLNLNQPVSGRPYTFTFVAGGDPNTPYTWSISPASANQLPTGLTIDVNTGIVSGTTVLTGFSKVITIRATDSISAFIDKSFTLTVGQGLTLQTGVDFIDTLVTNSLGYIDNGSPDSINPRPNRAFYVVATGVVSTSPAGMSASTNNPNITALVESVAAGTAFIKLSDAAANTGFVAGAVGINSLIVSVTDSGVNVNATFTWTIFDDGVLRLAPSSGSFPIQLTQ